MNAVVMILTIALQGVALWAFFNLPRIRRKDGALLMVGIGALLVRHLSTKHSLRPNDLPTQDIISIYRFVVFPSTTPSLLFEGPGSLNTPRDKTFFYVFHVAPEFLAAAVLVCIDVRGIYGTGLHGDRLWGSKP